MTIKTAKITRRLILLLSVAALLYGGEKQKASPTVFTLGQNYPNPFNPTTTIPFHLGQEGRVLLEINDLLGNRVRLLVDELLPEGEHRVLWNGFDDYGRSAPGGVYFCRMVFKGQESIQRMILIR